jgi:hypothetical protein
MSKAICHGGRAFSRPARAAIAMIVFALGVLGGAGAASWFMPY